MNPIITQTAFFALTLSLCLGQVQAESKTQPIRSADVLVYGGTASGVVAAVQCARLGKSVFLLEPGYHLGGMSSGGLGQTDIGNKAAIGGIAREFYQRVGREYGQAEAWKFEPHVAEKVFFDLVNEAGVEVYFLQSLGAVERSDQRITQLTTTNGRGYRAEAFIDASYEGDLLAAAQVGYAVGRESNSVYDETLNGIRPATLFHQFNVPVSPYKTSRQPDSGLLPLIQADPFGPFGGGDKRVQAYNYRMVLTKDPANQRPLLPPTDYRAETFEILGRYLGMMRGLGRKPQLTELMHIQPMPGGKTDINNNGPISINLIGGSWEYPEANHEGRVRIRKAHENYIRGFFHFLRTDPRSPQNIREEMARWGLCRDEFADTQGWPHQIYVREARRMLSDYVMTEKNCRRVELVSDSIGLAAYTMDSHNVRRVVRNGWLENEGDVQIGVYKPYPISFRSIVPKVGECENLAVSVCVSASHIAFGSIRMEPVFMVVGHSAATVACLSLDAGVPVQKLPYRTLKKKLLSDKQVLRWNQP